jgi:hypothetical protein
MHGDKRNAYRIWVETPEGIKCTLNEWSGRVRPGLNWLRIGATDELL